MAEIPLGGAMASMERSSEFLVVFLFFFFIRNRTAMDSRDQEKEDIRNGKSPSKAEKP